MQTILGAGGAIGLALADALSPYTKHVRMVSRTPPKIHGGEFFAADLRDAAQVEKAVLGSEVVYLTAGIPYKLKVWQQDWPLIMKNVINACVETKAKLVFFDNIYMLDKNHLGNITEDTPVNPPSRKGQVRASLNRMIFDEIEKGSMRAMIVRSADFYGPGIRNSLLLEIVPKNLSKGKAAIWFCSQNEIHSFTYTPDAAKACALLGNDPTAFNQVWNLPTAEPAMTGKEWVNAFAHEMKMEPKTRVASKNIIRLMGLFNPTMKEFVEMLYQYDRPFFFNSRKFTGLYPDFRVTSYLDGIAEVVRQFR